MNHLRWLFIVLFLVLGFIVAVENYATLVTPVTFKVDLFFFKYETSGLPLSLVAVITFFIGLISAWFYGFSERFRLRKQIKTLQLSAKEKDNELNSLRNLPVTAEDVTPAETTEEQ